MSLIPNFRGILLFGCISAIGLAGCQLQKTTPGPEPVSNAVIETDPAMALRQWDSTSAYYANDTVIAYPNYMPLQSKPLPTFVSAADEDALFVGNTFYTPVGIFIEFPWKNVPSKSLSMKPTYTAMPPLPPSAVSSSVASPASTQY